MTIISDIVAIEAFVKAKYPAPAHTYKQTPPLKPEPKTFVVRVIDDGRTTETRYHTRVDRTYQIVYYSDKVADVLTKMDALSFAFMDALIVPVSGSTRNIRVGTFSYSEPFETENDLFASIGVLTTEVREARTRPQWPLIGKVNVRQT